MKYKISTVDKYGLYAQYLVDKCPIVYVWMRQEASGVLRALYVGRTANRIQHRLEHHHVIGIREPYNTDTDYIKAHLLLTPEDTWTIELELIAELRPRYNVFDLVKLGVIRTREDLETHHEGDKKLIERDLGNLIFIPKKRELTPGKIKWLENMRKAKNSGNRGRK